MKSAIVGLALFLPLALHAGSKASDLANDFERVQKLDEMNAEADYNPQLSFGISLKMLRNDATRRIYALEISRVRAGSYAEGQGVKPGMRILRIDGKPVQYIAATFMPGSELGRVFVSRKPGDQVELQVVSPNSTEPKTIVLIEQRP